MSAKRLYLIFNEMCFLSALKNRNQLIDSMAASRHSKLQFHFLVTMKLHHLQKETFGKKNRNYFLISGVAGDDEDLPCHIIISVVLSISQQSSLQSYISERLIWL